MFFLALLSVGRSEFIVRRGGEAEGRSLSDEEAAGRGRGREGTTRFKIITD